MKKAYSLIALGILWAFMGTAAWADSIDQVVISEGPPVMVKITGTFVCDGTRAPFTLQTTFENKILIQIFTNPPQEGCVEENAPFYIGEQITPPENGDYQVIVLLYTGIPGSDTPVKLEDYEIVNVHEETAEGGLDINPNTINMKRRGQFINAKITMPVESSAADIDKESITLFIVKGDGELSDSIPAQWSVHDPMTDSLIVKFSNAVVLNLIAENVAGYPAAVKFLAQWKLQGDDTVYEGTDEVRVINPGKGKGKQ